MISRLNKRCGTHSVVPDPFLDSEIIPCHISGTDLGGWKGSVPWHDGLYYSLMISLEGAAKF